MKLLNEFPSPKFTRLGTVYIQGAYRSVYTLLNTHDVMIRVSSKRGPEEIFILVPVQKIENEYGRYESRCYRKSRYESQNLNN